MADFTQTLTGSYGGTLHRNLDTDENSQDNVASGPTIVYRVKCDLLENPNEDVTIRLWDHIGPTVGTTPAFWWMRFPKGLFRECRIRGGLSFASNLSYAAVKNIGGTAGADAPSGTVKVWIETT